jgi:predicted permease
MVNDPVFGRGIRAGVRRLFRLPGRTPASARADADEELDAYIEARIEHFVARGMKPAEARVEALNRLGGTLSEVRAILRYSAEQREGQMRFRDMVDDLLHDLRLTGRQFRKAPAFTAIALLTLALGIGANTAIFSVVHHVLLAPLPYPDGNRVVALGQTSDPGGGFFPASAPLVEAWAARSHTVEAFGASTEQSFRIDELSGQDSVVGAVITPSFLRVIGVGPALGRGFDSNDARPGASPVAMISTRLWKHDFGGRRDVIGSVIHVNGKPYTIVGVAPMSGTLPRGARAAIARATVPWRVGSPPDVWLPAMLDAATRSVGEPYAKLRPGVTAAAASNELDAIMKSLGDTARYGRSTARAMRAQDFLDAKEVRTIQVLFVAVGLLLLIACVNVANLLLARAWTRRRELAIRVTLGAGRARLVRQILTESLALALAGGALGILLAWQAVRLIIAMRPPSLEHLAGVHLEPSILLWSLGISLATGVLFGAAPALFAQPAFVGDALRGESRTASGSIASRRTRAGLVVAEVALSLVLLVGAGLLLRAFLTLQRTSLGFDPNGLVSVAAFVPPRSIPIDRRDGVREAVLDRLRAVPGVTAAAFGTLPGMGFGTLADLALEINGLPRATGIHASTTMFATADYFRVAQITLLSGRVFDSTGTGGEREVLINRSLALRLWPDGRAIGSRLRGAPNQPWSTVIGIVADVRMPGVRGGRDEIQIYQLPLPQIPIGAYLVRTPMTPPDALVPALQKAIAEVDSRLLVGKATTGDDALRDALAPARFAMALLAAFAMVALVLSMVGLYGVVAYAVTQRTREIGVRVALGAAPSAVTRLVIGDGLRLIAVGLVLGLAAAAASSRVLGSLLYGMSPADPVTYVGVVVLVIVIAVTASYAPARRALQIDPTEALRAE